MNVGDIVVIKLTGEPVFVVGIDNPVARVRRAVQTQDGLQYQEDAFTTEELLSQEEWFRQDLELKLKFHTIRESFESRIANKSGVAMATEVSNLPN